MAWSATLTTSPITFSAQSAYSCDSSLFSGLPNKRKTGTIGITTSGHTKYVLLLSLLQAQAHSNTHWGDAAMNPAEFQKGVFESRQQTLCSWPPIHIINCS